MISQLRWENLLVLFLCCFTAHSQEVDPCSSYRALNDPYRSTGHVAQAGDQLICDRSLQAGWYRFINEVGGQMPESAVPPLHCGTRAPIWMQGSHPSTADGIVNRTACVRFKDKNCFVSIPIKVKSCNQSAYYVYYLLTTSGCSLAYCAGSKVPCPRGQSGLSPNCTVLLEVNFPNALLPIPAITFNDDGKPDVSLKCSFEFPIWNNVSFEIRWVVNGRTVDPTTKLCTSPFENDCNKRHLLLTSKEYGPGDQVQCTLRSRYNTHPNNTWTFESFSSLFFAGIEVRPTNITLKECEIERNVKLEVRPTIPLIRSKSINEIGLMFGASNGKAVLANDCEIKIPTGTDSVNKWISTNVSVQALCDNQDGGSDQFQFTFHVTTFHSFWAQYTLPPVLITRVEKTVQLCIASGDPHYKTFDGRYYDFYRSGDFVLYRNTERTFEIHTRLWFCSSVTCNCGVAIREHRDIIILNSCATVYLPDGGEEYKMITGEPLKVRIASSGPLIRGTRIRVRHLGSFSEYEVRLPSGRRVTLKRYSWGNNIYMEASQGDLGNTEGMCGNFNGDSTDDFTGGGDGQSHSDQTSFGESWRVNKLVSLFETVPDCNEEQCDDSELNMDRCECERNQGQIHVTCGRKIMNWNEIKANPAFTDKTQKLVKAARNKRENLYSDDVIYHYDDEVYYLPHVRRRRAVQFISEENATNYCNTTLRGTSVAKACLEISDVDADSAIRQCSEDLQITGDFSWAASAIETIRSSCEVAVVRNVSAYEEDEDGKLVPPLKITKAICPNDCSGHGNCSDGVCVCNKEYVSADCSLRFDEIPDLIRLLDKGLCDIRARPCMKTIVFGEHFLSSENLTCHVEEFAVVSSKWIPSKTTLKFNGSQTDLFAIECNLPKPPINLDDFDSGSTPAAGYRVSVSNDGFHTSQALVMITFDLKCQSCNVSIGCSLKNDSCVIRGHCFAEEEPDPKNWCQQCLPSVNQNMWTTRLVNVPPNITTPAVRYALLGEDLSLQIEGEDPENRPFDISLMEGSPTDARLTDSGILIWKPATLNATKFYFKATDECNASSTFNMIIEIVTCPCTDKGVCVPDSMHARGSGMYICSCQPGYEGKLCENEIDECLSGPCKHGTCVDKINNYTCECQAGYAGHNCEVEIDECQSSPCVHGTCFDFVNDYNCTCQSGFTGLRCEENIDDCSPFPCGNGICVDDVNTYTCKCNVGFTGRHCDVIVKNCSNSSCFPGVTCIQHDYSISCDACPAGFVGDGKNCEDVDDCLNRTCNNSGSCVDGVNSYTCVCLDGFTGDHCETDVDDCLNRTCSNGGSCVDGVNSYTCVCLDGFTGDHCETDVDDCLNRTCSNGGSCVDGVNSYTCVCLDGFTGDHCETDVDDCLNRTCSNGGSCVDGVNSYTCVCLDGFTGDHCETDVDDCLNRTCNNSGSCVDGVNSYTCVCLDGFTGDHCETDIDDCVKHTCMNGASCVDHVNSYSCACPAGFSGQHCETDVGGCINQTCKNGGSCVDGVSSYTCVCLPGFTGNRCETEKTVKPTDPDNEVTTRTTTSKRNTDEQIAFVMEIRINMEFKEELRDEKSDYFKNISSLLLNAIWQAYSGENGLEDVELISLRPGSIMADFKLIFNFDVNEDEGLAPLKMAVADGKLGSLSVDPSSLKQKTIEDGPPEKSTNVPLIIGISCGVFFLVALVTVWYVRHRLKNRSKKTVPCSSAMPNEYAYPNPQRYEMKVAKKKEDIAWIEERGLPNSAME